MAVPGSQVSRAIRELNTKGYGDVVSLKMEPRSDPAEAQQGSGRVIKMANEMTLAEVVERTKKHFGVPRLRLATAREIKEGTYIKT